METNLVRHNLELQTALNDFLLISEVFPLLLALFDFNESR